MCRFVAYLGRKPVLMTKVLQRPENSLINQSKQAREGKLGLNGDGFGIGWYNFDVDPTPGLFKSIQPAWNDSNLKHISSKIASTCFIGHVRASTIGDVSALNCHPFARDQFLFVHNGTIRDFYAMKKHLIHELSDKNFDKIRGQTDSEYFFSLLMDNLKVSNKTLTEKDYLIAFRQTIDRLSALQEEFNLSECTKMNAVLTDGKRLMATRYISNKKEKPLSLYYVIGDYIDTEYSMGVMNSTNHEKNAILIASEPLTDNIKEWQELPINHALLINEDLEASVESI